MRRWEKTICQQVDDNLSTQRRSSTIETPRAVRLTGSLSTGSHAKLPFHLGDRKNAMHGCAVIIPFVHSFISFDSRGHKMRGGSLSLGEGGLLEGGAHNNTTDRWFIFNFPTKGHKDSKLPKSSHSVTVTRPMGPSSRKVRLPWYRKSTYL